MLRNTISRVAIAGSVATLLALSACASDSNDADDCDDGVGSGQVVSDEAQDEVGGAQPAADGGFTDGEDAPTDAIAESGSVSTPDDSGSSPPVPIGAVAQGDASVDGSVTTQSFVIEGDTPEGIINSYQEFAQTNGWETADGPTKTGEDAYQLEMVKNGASLSVTTGLDGSNAGAGQDTVELSIEVTAA